MLQEPNLVLKLLVANDIECFNQHHITRHKSGRILESKFRVKAQ